MKANIVLLLETVTGILTLFFGVLAIMTPWCAWRIACIVLCCVIGISFIAFAILSRTKYKPVEDVPETTIENDETKTAEQ